MPVDLSGWLLDVYADAQSGLVVWLLGEDGQRYQLQQPFRTTFYAAGPFPACVNYGCIYAVTTCRCGCPAPSGKIYATACLMSCLLTPMQPANLHYSGAFAPNSLTWIFTTLTFPSQCSMQPGLIFPPR
jgi:hypothetical protein